MGQRQFQVFQGPGEVAIRQNAGMAGRTAARMGAKMKKILMALVLV
jgi:hypothetical protein